MYEGHEKGYVNEGGSENILKDIEATVIMRRPVWHPAYAGGG